MDAKIFSFSSINARATNFNQLKKKLVEISGENYPDSTVTNFPTMTHYKI